MSLDELMEFDRPGSGYAERRPGRRLFTGGPSDQRARLRMGATRLGISEQEYLAHTERGELWCSRHRAWHPADDFAPDPRRPRGKQTSCRRRPAEGTPS
jgi:hypothetical protein